MHARQGQIKLWFTRLCYFQTFSDIFSLADPLCAIITLLSGIRTVIRRLEIAVEFMISTVRYFFPENGICLQGDSDWRPKAFVCLAVQYFSFSLFQLTKS